MILNSVVYAHSREMRSNQINQPPMIALGILNMVGILNMMPPILIIVAIRTCIFLINFINWHWLMRNQNDKEKGEKKSSRHEILPKE